MLTANEVKVLDINAEYFGTPAVTLMENAGKHVASFIENKFENPNILIFCGLGNNGGDGFVAARYLSKKNKVTVFLIGKEKNIHSSIAHMNFVKLKKNPIKIFDINSISKIDELIDDSNVIVDAMLGIGLSGELREPYNNIVTKINNRNDKEIISVDVPTGLGMSLSLKANDTITFHDEKHNMGKNSCGEIHIKKIGIPVNAEKYVGPGELSIFYPRPKKDSHKGENGRILIIGGGPFTGAPALSGLAALATGADLVTITTPKDIASIVSSFSPNLIVKPMTSDKIFSNMDIDNIKKLCESIDCIIIGPGLGSAPETLEAIRSIVLYFIEKKIPIVIDADGITAFNLNHDIIKNSSVIITPHANEFKCFTGENLNNEIENRISTVVNWAKKLNISIFLKGSTDILTDGSIFKLNNVHNEAMTVGGTGDVLTGVIGALLSKGVSFMSAMRISAFLNGEAGNLSFNEKSYGLVATDIIEKIPFVLKKYL